MRVAGVSGEEAEEEEGEKEGRVTTHVETGSVSCLFFYLFFFRTMVQSASFVGLLLWPTTSPTTPASAEREKVRARLGAVARGV